MYPAPPATRTCMGGRIARRHIARRHPQRSRRAVPPRARRPGPAGRAIRRLRKGGGPPPTAALCGGESVGVSASVRESASDGCETDSSAARISCPVQRLRGDANVVRSSGDESRPAFVRPGAVRNGGEPTAFVFLPTWTKGEPRSVSFCPSSVNVSEKSQAPTPTSVRPRMKSRWRSPISVKFSPIPQKRSPMSVWVSEISANVAKTSVRGSPRSAQSSPTSA